MVGLFTQTEIGHIAHDDAMARRSLYIDLVDTGTEPRNGPTPRTLCDHRLGHLG